MLTLLTIAIKKINFRLVTTALNSSFAHQCMRKHCYFNCTKYKTKKNKNGIAFHRYFGHCMCVCLSTKQNNVVYWQWVKYHQAISFYAFLTKKKQHR